MLINDSFEAAFGIIGIIIASQEYDDFFSNDGKKRYEETPKGTALRCLVSIMTVLMFGLAFRHYYLTFINYKNSGKLINDHPFWKTTYFK